MINTKLLRSCYHHINFLSTINSKLLFLFLFFCFLFLCNSQLLEINWTGLTNLLDVPGLK